MFKKSAAPSSGYNLTKSLRLRSSASAYLSRTPGSSGNKQKFTFSFWVKLGATALAGGDIVSSNNGSGGGDAIEFQSTSHIALAGSGTNFLVTNAVYRDPSAWYHIVYAVDTTQSTAANRLILYVNGSQVTSFSTTNYPSQNYSFSYWNTSGQAQLIGNGYSYYDGLVAEFNFIDGQQLTASAFGSTNATTGVWQPTKYTGTYGTNGFYLPFTNTTSTSTLGNDFSGNGNTWTVNNVSLTAGTTYDSMTDVPTLTSAIAGNYPVLNPLAINYGITAGYYTISDGNLFASATGTEAFATTTMQMESGKYYAEFYVNLVSSTSISQFGIATTSLVDTRVYRSDGNYNAGAGNVAYGATYTTGDYVSVAVDITNNTIEFFKNGVSQGQKTGISTTGKSWFFWVYSGGGNSSWYANYGQQGFKYTPPAGFVALNTYNLPTSTIVNGSTKFDINLYTGTSASQSLTNAQLFQPSFIWLKSRSNSTNNVLHDVLRGTAGIARLFSDSTAAESATGDGFVSINSNGFSLDGSGGGGDVNTTGRTYVAWQWAGPSSGTSNTDGSVTSTVALNATAGFSVVSFNSGSAGGKTVGHGLGVTPAMIIMKVRTAVGAWYVWNQSLSSSTSSFLVLNSSAAAGTDGSLWNGTAPTSTVFSFYSNYYPAANQDVIAYCWSAIPGFSAFGSYVGNGNSSGPFVYCGFRPKYTIIKRSDSGNDWFLQDSVRSPYNTNQTYLAADSSAAEVTSSQQAVDYLSNGFKLRTGYDQANGSGGTYIYAAFAENPFRNALAR
jgi:Concanavalin A-like lectin/glucanases superfamily